MDLGSNIKKNRKLKDLTQKELANLVGVTASTITKYENNSLEPNIDTIGKIATALNTSVNDLLGMTSNPRLEWFISDITSIAASHDEKELYDMLDYTKGLIKEGLNKHVLKDLSEYLKMFHNALIGYYANPFDNGLVNLENELTNIQKQSLKKSYEKMGVLSLIDIVKQYGSTYLDDLQLDLIRSYYKDDDNIPDFIKPIINMHK